MTISAWLGRRQRPRRACVALVLSACFWPQPSHAAGFASARFGGELGNVTSHNPTALYYNPAGIAWSDGVRLFVDGTLALRHLTWEHSRAPRDVPEPPGAEGADTGRARLLNLFGAPMAGVSVRRGALALGASVSVPFGGRAAWDQNPHFVGDARYPLAADGVQRWHNIDGSLAFVYLTAGVAYRVGPLALGLAGNLIRSSVASRQSKNLTGHGDPDLEREGRSTLDVSGWHGSVALGVVLELAPDRVWLAASYQAQPALGAMQLDGRLTLDYQGVSRPYAVTLHQALPDITRFGARIRLRRDLELRLFGDFTRWSVLGTQCISNRGTPCAVFASGADASGTTIQNIRRAWRDTMAAHAGVSHWLADAIELFAGVGFETAAVPDATLEPGLADARHVEGALGARLRAARQLFVSGTYTQLWFFARDTTGRSRLADADPPTSWPDAGGRYSQWISVLNVNVEQRF